MAFTYDLTTNVGLVRFRIGDSVEGSGPRPDGRNFSDEEVERALTDGSTVEGAIGVLQSVLASEWAVVPDFSIGSRRESMSQVHSAFTEAAKNSGVSTHITFAGGFKRVDGYSEDAQ